MSVSKFHFWIITIIAVVFSFTSCDKVRYYEKYQATGATGWHKDSLLSFVVGMDDQTKHYNLYINTRNLEQYQYSNLWLFVDVIAPDATIIRDTVEFTLAYPNGKWIGKGASGVYLNQFKYRTNIFFPIEGDYTFRIRHAMRDEKLKGINDIGIRIEKRK